MDNSSVKMIYDDYALFTFEHKQKYGDKTLVLIEIGSFWEYYDCDKHRGADVKIVSELLNIAMTRKNKSIPEISRTNPLMGGFPTPTLKKYLPVLLDDGYTVVLVSQVTPPPNPKRAVTKIYSKGTYIDNIRTSNSTNLMSIYIETQPDTHGKMLVFVGIGIVDLATGKSHAGEIFSTKMDPESALDELYRLITVLDPIEIMVMGKNIGFDRIVRRLEISDRNIYDRTEDSFDSHLLNINYQDAILKKVYNDTGLLRPAEFIDLERCAWALPAFVAIIQFSHQHDETVVARISKPEALVRSGTLTVCYNTLRQLGVVSNEVNNKRSPSLLKVLNRCNTGMGRRCFMDRLLNPVTDIEELNKRYDKIEGMLKFHKTVKSALRDVCDLERCFRRVELSIIKPADLVTAYESLQCVLMLLKDNPMISDFMKSQKAIRSSHSFSNTIISCIDLQSAASYPSASNMFFFQKGKFPELETTHDDIQVKLKQLSDAAIAVNGKVECTERDGHYIITTPKRLKDAVKSNTKCLFDLQDMTTHAMGSYVRLDHPAVRKISKDIRDMSYDLEKGIDSAYKAFLVDVSNAHKQDMRNIIELVSDLDVSSTCAANAFEFRYCRPVLQAPGDADDSSRMIAKDMRHPVIERVRDDEEYIPNDFEIGTGSSRSALLYGLNAAGKSSLVKSIGINVLMAQAGMYAAARVFEIVPYSQLMSRISTGDDIFKGQSTFTIEMSELRNILARCDNRSLIIGDELCAGTEHHSALAIVAAGLDCMTKKNASFVLATHLHDLPNIEEVKRISGMRLFHLTVSIDRSTGELTYHRKLKDGSGDALYGIEVMRALRLESDMVLMAQKIRHDLLGIENKLVNTKKSRYNKKVYVDMCSKCGDKPAVEVHHKHPQKDADEDGFIGHFHKNSKHNLMGLCSQCHDEIHSNTNTNSFDEFRCDHS
jgi:DNA mismatch repair protein MutS